MTILGSGFTPETTVRFNRNPGVNVHILSSTQIQVTTPPLGDGPFATALSEVRATNASGEGYAEFLYLPPTLDEIRPGDVTTIAGVGNFVGDGRLATQALVEAEGLAFDAAGNLYLGEETGGRVRRVDHQSGRITTFVGTGVIGFSGDGGPATDAQLNWPQGVAIDSLGNIYIADGPGNNRVRKVDATSSIVHTIAGSTEPNQGGDYGGDGGPATLAKLNNPQSVSVDAAGNVYVFDAYNNRIRRIDTSGIITTFAGNGTAGFSGDGGPAAQASFNIAFDRNGDSMAVDSRGNVYIQDYGNSRIRRVGLDGIVNTVVGGGNVDPTEGALATQVNGFAGAIAVDLQDRLLFSDNSHIWRVEANGMLTRIAGVGRGLSPDGVLAKDALMIPLYLAVAPNGDVIVSERSAKRIRRIDAKTGILSTVAGIGPATVGDGGSPALAAVFEDIGNIGLDKSGNIMEVEPRGSHRIRRIDAMGRITTLAGRGVEAIGAFYHEGIEALDAGMGPISVEADTLGNIFFTDFCSVRRVGTDGLIRTVAGSLTNPQDCGFAGDGGPGMLAKVAEGQDTLKLDGGGDIFIADLGNHRVRRVDAATGIITTFAGSGPGEEGPGGFAGDGGPATQGLLSGPSDVAFDSGQNTCIADYGNGSIRCVDSQGTIRTVAGRGTDFPGDGGPGIEVALAPYRIAFDATGNMYINDGNDGRIRKLDSNGIISTVAGIPGVRGFSGDGGSALQATLDYGSGLAIDSNDNLLIFDGENRRIRVIKQGAIVAPPNPIVVRSSGSPQSAPISHAFALPLEVAIEYSSGRPAPGVRVDFSAPPSGATCVFSNLTTSISVLTDKTGKASAVCTALCAPGSYSVTATPLASGKSVSFSLKNLPAADIHAMPEGPALEARDANLGPCGSIVSPAPPQPAPIQGRL